MHSYVILCSLCTYVFNVFFLYLIYIRYHHHRPVLPIHMQHRRLFMNCFFTLCYYPGVLRQLQHQFHQVLITHSVHHRFCRPGNIFFKIQGQISGKLICCAINNLFHFMAESDLNDPAEGWIEKLFTAFYFRIVKSNEIMLLHILQYWMCKVTHLNEYFSATVFSAGTSAYLLHQLESTFIDPEISKTQKTVSIHDTNEIYMLEIKSFNYHLSSHQYIQLL